MQKGPAPAVKSAERVLDIIEYVARQPAGVAFPELTSALDIPKSSLHALLEGLNRRGYLAFDEERRRYRLGLRLWEAGQAYRRHHDVMDVAGAALDALVAAVNETAQMARLSGRDNVYVARRDSSHALRLQSEVGARLPAHATGVGKALLAQLPDAEVRTRLGDAAPARFTATTLADLPALLAELQATRARGFAVDREEYTPGVVCLAVPVFERAGPATLALSVSVPSIRAGADRLAPVLRELAAASLAISRRLGAGPPDPHLVALGEGDAAARAIAALDLPAPPD